MKNTKKMAQCSRILLSLNSFLESEFNKNGFSDKFNIWSERYDKIADFYLSLTFKSA